MLFESEKFEARLPASDVKSEHVFKYCDFTGINTEGGIFDAIFVGCDFDECEWYWGLFTCAIFVQVTFKACTFRGTSFSSCKFVECEFIDCAFARDNLNAECTFDDVAWYKCKQQNCIGLEQEFRNKR
jgi:uncharacterized protein YjbI with pentapeptide repeats